MKSFFTELFEYQHHYNQALGNIFQDNPGKTSAKALQLYNHILNAHQIWNNRIYPQQPTFGVWDIHPTAACKSIDQDNYAHSILIMDNVDLNTNIDYTNTKGLTFNNSIRDVLFHIINHSTYHRAQIATEFKQNSLEPLNTDFIFYKRG